MPRWLQSVFLCVHTHVCVCVCVCVGAGGEHNLESMSGCCGVLIKVLYTNKQNLGSLASEQLQI
jgi:hypothetical protein